MSATMTSVDPRDSATGLMASTEGGEQHEMRRRYALHRLGAGSYLLPSNDGTTLWWIYRYTDGPTLGLEDWPSDRDVWGARRWPKPFDVNAGYGPIVESFEDNWDRWDDYATTLPTRAEAIRCALAASKETGA